MIDIDSSSHISELSTYWAYLQRCCPNIDIDMLSHLKEEAIKTNWEEPESAIELNNVAVIALIEADNTTDLSERAMYWEFALEALKQGVKLPNSLLCKVHLAIIYSLIGDESNAIYLSYDSLPEIIQSASIADCKQPLGLVYLPQHQPKWTTVCKDRLPNILQAANGSDQAFAMTTQILCHSRLVFYSPAGLRFLQLATQFNANSAILNLQLGISGLFNQQLESLSYLQRAYKLAPESALVIQSLYIAYRDRQQISSAEQWKAIAATYAKKNPQDLKWQWANLAVDSSFTYVPFDNNLLLAVLPSFRSIVTAVLIAQQDWFEFEMELWRDQIQSGMTVIDVGANVGVYTYSAAQLVGETGKVLAIEPFSGCVQCLEETRTVNQLNWVRVLSGAASDRNGIAQLATNAASEQNELLSEDFQSSVATDNTEKVPCFTLDSLIVKENLSRVDWLKIDAEGHEIQVLVGADQILREFKPNILYENIAGNQSPNIAVAEHLRRQGYQIFRYIPYLKQLVLTETNEDLQGILNLVALPTAKEDLSDSLDMISPITVDLPTDNSPVQVDVNKNDISYKIVMVVSGGLREFVENTLVSIEKCNISLENVEIFAPRVAIKELQEIRLDYPTGNITALEDITDQLDLQNNDKYYDYATADFGKFTISKWFVIKHLLNQGVRQVIYTDVDIVWRADPLPLLQQISSTYELAIQTEGNNFFPPAFCTGFMSFINTDFSHHLLESLISLHSHFLETDPECHDQIAFNILISNNPQLGKNIFGLSEMLFANGKLAQLMSTSNNELIQIQIKRADPMIFHANWTMGLANKKNMLKLTGNWLL
jgi:FkbM family methyltransferase